MQTKVLPARPGIQGEGEIDSDRTTAQDKRAVVVS